MVQRSLSFLLAAGLVSCSGDPTGDLANGPDHLIATPSAIYVENGVVSTVIVTALDEAGNQVADDFSLSAADVGPNIVVSEDSTYNLIRNAKGEFVRDPHPTRIRYNVKTDLYVASEFTVRAGSRSITIPVRTEPTTLVSTVSTVTPAAGQQVTINAPTGLSFSPTASTVTFGTTATQLITRSATAITFVAPPSAGGPATVSNVSLDYAPGAGLFAVPTAQAFTVPALPLITATPGGARAIGDTITIVIPAPYKWITGSTATVGTAPKSPNVVSADSATVKFAIGPNANDTVRVTGIGISGAPALGGFLMKSLTVVSSPVVSNFAGVLSNATPAAGQEISITAPSNFRFLSTATATVGGLSQNATRISADSSQLFLTPVPNAAAAGVVTVTGIVFSNLRSVSLTLPTIATLTPPVGPPPALAGTDALATAPTVALPTAAGQRAIVTDAGANFAIAECLDEFGGNCRVYKFVLPSAVRLTFTARWGGTADLGVYFLDSTFAGTGPVCDAFPGGAAGQPETCVANFAAGTYYMASVYYGGGVPAWRQVFVSGSAVTP